MQIRQQTAYDRETKRGMTEYLGLKVAQPDTYEKHSVYHLCTPSGTVPVSELATNGLSVMYELCTELRICLDSHVSMHKDLLTIHSTESAM